MRQQKSIQTLSGATANFMCISLTTKSGFLWTRISFQVWEIAIKNVGKVIKPDGYEVNMFQYFWKDQGEKLLLLGLMT